MSIEELKMQPMVVYGIQKGTLIPVAQLSYNEAEDRAKIIDEIFTQISEASQDDKWCQFGATLFFPNTFDGFKVM